MVIATILHSFDGGKSWEIYQDVDFDAPFLSIHMYDDYERLNWCICFGP